LQDASREKKKNCTTLNQKLNIISTTANQREYSEMKYTGRQRGREEKKKLVSHQCSKNNDLIFVLDLDTKHNREPKKTDDCLCVFINVKSKERSKKEREKKTFFEAGKIKLLNYHVYSLLFALLLIILF
jgi:hypothetical protein